MTTLQHIADQTVRHSRVGIREVHGGRASSISKAGHVSPERSKLTIRDADGGYVDLSSRDLQAPVPNLGDRGEGLVDDGGQLAAKVGRSSGCSSSRAANSAGKRHDPSCGIIRLHEVVASRDGIGDSRTNGIGEGHGVIDLETQEITNRDIAAGGGKSRGAEAGLGVCRLIPESARSARQYRGVTGHGL